MLQQPWQPAVQLSCDVLGTRLMGCTPLSKRESCASGRTLMLHEGSPPCTCAGFQRQQRTPSWLLLASSLALRRPPCPAWPMQAWQRMQEMRVGMWTKGAAWRLTCPWTTSLYCLLHQGTARRCDALACCGLCHGCQSQSGMPGSGV